MGFKTEKRPVLYGAQGVAFTLVGTASSAGASIGPRGLYGLYSTSTAAATPTVMYLRSPSRLGDTVEAYCKLASSSAGLVLRTTGTGITIGSSSDAYDSIFFAYDGSGVKLVAYSSVNWQQLGASTTATGSIPTLMAATS